MKRARPILHARDHMAGGADPIPGLLPSATGSFPSKVLALSGLVGYWRLGESASPFADTSGHPSGPANMNWETMTGHPLITSGGVGGAPIEGADGYVGFDTDNWQPPENERGDWLQTAAWAHLLPPSTTLAVWLNPTFTSSLSPWRGQVFGSLHATPAAGFPGGQAIVMDYPTLEVKYIRAQGGSSGTTWVAVNAGSLDPFVWVLIVATYDAATDELRIYRDGALADSESGSPTVNGATGLALGRTVDFPTDYAQPLDFLRPAWYHGSADEAAVWDRALTPSEIFNLSVNGPVVISDDDGHPAWGQVQTAGIADGAVTTIKIADGTITNIDVDAAAAIDPTKLSHPGGTSLFLRGDGTWAAAGSDPAVDTKVWMPLVDSDGTVVLDSHGVIPTLITL